MANISPELNKIIYSGSVLGYTPVIIRAHGIVSLRTIESLADIWETVDARRDMQQATLCGAEAWTNIGWAPVYRVIRRRSNRSIFRILTHTGLVDVTEDCSIISETSLAHSYPYVDFIDSGDLFMNKNTVNTAHQLLAAEYYMTLRSQGYNVSINTLIRKWNFYRITWTDHKARKTMSAIKKILLLHEHYDDYVYDLETGAGNYQAGIGQLVIKSVI